MKKLTMFLSLLYLLSCSENQETGENTVGGEFESESIIEEVIDLTASKIDAVHVQYANKPNLTNWLNSFDNFDRGLNEFAMTGDLRWDISGGNGNYGENFIYSINYVRAYTYLSSTSFYLASNSIQGEQTGYHADYLWAEEMLQNMAFVMSFTKNGTIKRDLGVIIGEIILTRDEVYVKSGVAGVDYFIGDESNWGYRWNNRFVTLNMLSDGIMNSFDILFQSLDRGRDIFDENHATLRSDILIEITVTYDGLNYANYAKFGTVENDPYMEVENLYFADSNSDSIFLTWNNDHIVNPHKIGTAPYLDETPFFSMESYNVFLEYKRYDSKLTFKKFVKENNQKLYYERYNENDKLI